MTLKEMLYALHTYGELNIRERDAIIAALKAGQAMRKAFTGPVLDYQDMTIALQAWDAATKEDDK